MSREVWNDWLSGKRQTLTDKAEACQSEAELDGFLAGFAHTGREPSREVIEAIARRRAQLRTGRT